MLIQNYIRIRQSLLNHTCFNQFSQKLTIYNLKGFLLQSVLAQQKQ